MSAVFDLASRMPVSLVLRDESGLKRERDGVNLVTRYLEYLSSLGTRAD